MIRTHKIYIRFDIKSRGLFLGTSVQSLLLIHAFLEDLVHIFIVKRFKLVDFVASFCPFQSTSEYFCCRNLAFFRIFERKMIPIVNFLYWDSFFKLILILKIESLALVLYTKSANFYRTRTKRTLTQACRFAVCFSLLYQRLSLVFGRIGHGQQPFWGVGRLCLSFLGNAEPRVDKCNDSRLFCISTKNDTILCGIGEKLQWCNYYGGLFWALFTNWWCSFSC